MLFPVVIVLVVLLPAFSATIPAKQRVLLQIDLATAKIAANVVKYTPTPEQATVFQAGGAAEDSRIVNSRSNTFLMDSIGYEKFEAVYKTLYGAAVTTIVL